MEKFCMVGPFIEIPHISGLHEIKRKQGVHSKKIYKGIDLKFKFHPYTGEELQTVVTSTQKIYSFIYFNLSAIHWSILHNDTCIVRNHRHFIFV